MRSETDGQLLLGCSIAEKAEIVGSVFGDEAQDLKAKPRLDAEGGESDELAAPAYCEDEGLGAGRLGIEACAGPGVAKEGVPFLDGSVKRVPLRLQRVEATNGPHQLELELVRVGRRGD